MSSGAFGSAQPGKRGGALPAPLPVRFWSKVEFPDGCWLWVGARNDSGYGVIWDGTRLVYAHRLAYELLVGPIDDDLTLDHLCRTKLCIRPDHLEPVSRVINIQRAVDARGPRTHCPRGHEYSPENTYMQSGKYKVCKACRRETAALRRAA